MNDAAAKAAEETEADICCANCGIAGVDDITLQECNDCDLVKYCGDKCQKNHREQHEEECNKRKASLHDRKLFTQPDETHRGECPLCFLPMPIDPRKFAFYACCSQYICKGCGYANRKSYINDPMIEAMSCPFCREPAATGKKENKKRMMKRVKANDPAAMKEMGLTCYEEGDYGGAFEYLTKAAKLGDFDSHYHLGAMYGEGGGVEKDAEKSIHHYEKAAIGGHPYARYSLSYLEEKNGNTERAVKHAIIAANLGHENSMKALWTHYSRGNITKEDLDATLRTHHAAIDATKSEERKVAEKGVSESKADYWRRIGLV
jgi:tetratricopeptide (TPR) repeat protein